MLVEPLVELRCLTPPGRKIGRKRHCVRASEKNIFALILSSKSQKFWKFPKPSRKGHFRLCNLRPPSQELLDGTHSKAHVSKRSGTEWGSSPNLPVPPLHGPWAPRTCIRLCPQPHTPPVQQHRPAFCRRQHPEIPALPCAPLQALFPHLTAPPPARDALEGEEVNPLPPPARQQGRYSAVDRMRIL